jgi:hypothetical protein
LWLANFQHECSDSNDQLEDWVHHWPWTWVARSSDLQGFSGVRVRVQLSEPHTPVGLPRGIIIPQGIRKL